MAEAVLQRLRELGDEYNLRDPRTLFQIAQRQGVAGATVAIAKEALAVDVEGRSCGPLPKPLGRWLPPGQTALCRLTSSMSVTTCPRLRRAIATQWCSGRVHS